MVAKICLDTDFLVNFLRNKNSEVEFVRKHEQEADLTTTYINLFELYYGAFKSRQKQVNLKSISLLMNRINVLNFSDESVRKAGEILARLESSGDLIDFRDLFVGTVALVNSYSIKTGNKKHFAKIQGLNILD